MEKTTMTLTKAELADLLFEKVGLNKREAKDMVEAFFDEIRSALEIGDGVKLSGFGNFQLRNNRRRTDPDRLEATPINSCWVRASFADIQTIQGIRADISILIENEAGALSRVAGLFSARSTIPRR